jgi:hypothetical protein
MRSDGHELWVRSYYCLAAVANRALNTKVVTYRIGAIRSEEG